MKRVWLILGLVVVNMYASVDSCGAAVKEFNVALKVNEFYGSRYKVANKKYAKFGEDAANKVLEECRDTSNVSYEVAMEEATYYLTYYSEGLALADSGKTYKYEFVQDTCWNMEKVTEVIDHYIYRTYKGIAGDGILLYRTTTDLLRDTAVRAASICEDTRVYELMGKAQEIYNKYESH